MRKGRLDLAGIVVADAAVEGLPIGAAAVIADLLAVGEPVFVTDALAGNGWPDLPGAPIAQVEPPDPIVDLVPGTLMQ